jgi:hypothetical protein
MFGAPHTAQHRFPEARRGSPTAEGVSSPRSISNVRHNL